MDAFNEEEEPAFGNENEELPLLPTNQMQPVTNEKPVSYCIK